MGCPRQEYWSGLSFPSPGNLPDPGIEPTSPPSAGGFFPAEPPGKQKGDQQLPKVIIDFALLSAKGGQKFRLPGFLIVLFFKNEVPFLK